MQRHHVLFGVIFAATLFSFANSQSQHAQFIGVNHQRMLLQIQTTTIKRSNATNATRTTTPAAAAVTKDPPLWQSIYTVLIVLFMFIVLATEYFQAECVMLAALTILMCSGFLPTSNALIGFSNEGMLTVISLMAFAQGLEAAGALEILRWMLEFGTTSKTSIQFILLRLCVIAGTISAFLNNTPVVAFFIPVLQEFCQKYGFSTAEVMLPLSYSVILGGTVTTIGTSTNLVATGLYASKLNAVEKTNKYNANNVLGLFEMGKIGLPVLLAGIVYIVAASPLIFKGRRVTPWTPEHVKTYCLQMRLGKGCNLIGKRIANSGMLSMGATLVAHLQGSTASTVIDENHHESAKDTEVPNALNQNALPADDIQVTDSTKGAQANGEFSLPIPDSIIHEGDVLVFRAELHMLPELLRFDALNFDVLKNGDFGMFGKEGWHTMVYRDDRRLVEAAVSGDSPAVGMTTGDSFREQYGGFVVSVHRHGNPLLSYHDVKLQSGDSLLILTTDSFFTKYSRDSTFSVVKLVANYRQKRHQYAPALGSLSLVLMIILSQVLNEPQFGNISILKTALCGMIFMAMTGCASQQQMLSGAKIDLLIMIAVGFGLSEALTISGGAKMVATWIVNAANGNPVGLVSGTYFVVTLFNAAVTNNAAVSIFFPIAWEIANQSNMDFYPILLTLMFAGSADFSTPYGYQCNLMVYAPGGYSFSDYLKFGVPLQIVCAIFTVSIVFSMDYWWVYAVVFAFLAMAIVIAFFLCGGHVDHAAPNQPSLAMSVSDIIYTKDIEANDPVLGELSDVKAEDHRP